MFDKLRNKLLKYAIVVSGLFTTGTSLVSCDKRVDHKEILDNLQDRNPSADTLNTVRIGETDLYDEYAERFTDSIKIKNIKEKYKAQLDKYEHNLDSLTKMQHQVDAMLLEAASRGDMLGVKEALENGADINAKDKTGKTALICAVSKSEQHKYYETADYLLGEPGIRTNIQDKNKLSARDYINTLVTKYDAEWKNILRKLDEPTTERRNRGNSNVERFARLLLKDYNKLISTYGKEMSSALGYTYRGTSFFPSKSHVAVNASGLVGEETILNEDCSKNVVEVKSGIKHPSCLAKLKLKKPYIIDRTAEIVGKPSTETERKRVRSCRRYHKTIETIYQVTTTRDGQHQRKQVKQGRI